MKIKADTWTNSIISNAQGQRCIGKRGKMAQKITVRDWHKENFQLDGKKTGKT